MSPTPRPAFPPRLRITFGVLAVPVVVCGALILLRGRLGEGPEAVDGWPSYLVGAIFAGLGAWVLLASLLGWSPRSRGPEATPRSPEAARRGRVGFVAFQVSAILLTYAPLALAIALLGPTRLSNAAAVGLLATGTLSAVMIGGIIARRFEGR